MNPLLFPYTYIGPQTAAAAARFFPALTLYQPVGGHLPKDIGPWVSDGFLKFRIPVPDDSDLIVAAVRDFQLWAQQHLNGGDLRTILPRAVAPRPPFFDDSATAQILSDLKPGLRDAASPAPALYNARLFLCLAQDLDQGRWELNRQLDRAEADSHALMHELRSGRRRDGAGLNPPPGILQDDASEFMLSERLSAWAQLFLADSSPETMLLTTSRSIIADLIAGNDTAAVLMRMNADESTAPDEPTATEFRATLMARIESACHQSWPSATPPGPAVEGAGTAADLTIYLVPNQSLRSFVCNFGGLSPSGRIQPQPQSAETHHVVVGLLNPGRS